MQVLRCNSFHYNDFSKLQLSLTNLQGSKARTSIILQSCLWANDNFQRYTPVTCSRWKARERAMNDENCGKIALFPRTLASKLIPELFSWRTIHCWTIKCSECSCPLNCCLLLYKCRHKKFTQLFIKECCQTFLPSGLLAVVSSTRRLLRESSNLEKYLYPSQAAPLAESFLFELHWWLCKLMQNYISKQ